MQQILFGSVPHRQHKAQRDASGGRQIWNVREFADDCRPDFLYHGSFLVPIASI